MTPKSTTNAPIEMVRNRIATIFRGGYLHNKLNAVRVHSDWKARAYGSPSPFYIKHALLRREGLPGGIWVETGTYMGQTTHELSRIASMVYSIEPEKRLFQAASHLFKGRKNVTIINGTSEEVFPKLIPNLSGAINFWLDGHYSAGVTFRGANDTPIAEELKCISENIGKFQSIRIFIDDVRCFDPSQPQYSTYPPLDYLVDWCREHSFKWTIEHDIFFAKR